jgi:pimeloyl-ACP methyl ester carboxylesterase
MQPTTAQWQALRDSEARVLAGTGIPVSMHDITLDGEQMHYLEAGDAHLPPLVMIHGRGSSSGLWYSIFRFLASHRHLIAIDLRGWGLSARTPFAGSTGQEAMDWWRDGALKVIDALGIKRFDLLGHSLGGMVALSIALVRPQAVDHLALEDPGGFGTTVPLGVRLYFSLTPERLARATPRPLVDLLNGMHDPHKQGMTLSRRDLNTYVYLLTTLPGTDASGIRAFRQIVTLGGVHFTLRDRVKEILTPTCAIWGTRDGTLPLKESRPGLMTMPHAQLVALPGAHHSPHFEIPAIFARAVLEFLATGSEVPVTETQA